MSTKEVKEKQRAPGTYDRIGSSGGTLTIGGAEKKWAEDETFTYCPAVNRAGPLEDIKEWLSEHKPKQTKAVLRGAFNPKNLEDPKIKAAYERELENAEEERKLANEEKRKRLRFNLKVVIGLDKMYREQKKNQKDNIDPRGKGKRQSNLKDKVMALKGEGKVLDVTSMDEKGNKGKKATWSAKSVRRRLSTDKTDRFYYVVYNPTNENASEGVRNFLEKYGGFDDSRIDTVVEAIEDGGKVNFSKGRSPMRSSPYLSPSAKSKKKGAKKSDTKKGSKSSTEKKKGTKAKKSTEKKTRRQAADTDDEDDEPQEEEDIFGDMSDDDE